MDHGFYLIDKPVGISSSDITIKLKHYLKQKKTKFGLSGTLDPAASGLLVIGHGKATRFFQYLLPQKTYEFSVQFGTRTNTGDLEGDVIETDNKTISKELLLPVLNEFLGKTIQTPNKFSAIKINGKRAYELARSNIEFQMPVRQIYIHNLELINFENNKAEFIVSCNSGLYVRTLAEDIAKKLETICVVINLRRIASNGFDISMIEKNTIKTNITKQNYFEFNLHGKQHNVPMQFLQFNCLYQFYKTIYLEHDIILRLNKGQRIKTRYDDIDFALCVDDENALQGAIKIAGGIISPLFMINI